MRELDAAAGRNPKTWLALISWIGQLQYLQSRLECVVAGIRVLSGTVSDMEVGIKWVEEHPEMQGGHGWCFAAKIPNKTGVKTF